MLQMIVDVAMSKFKEYNPNGAIKLIQECSVSKF